MPAIGNRKPEQVSALFRRCQSQIERSNLSVFNDVKAFVQDQGKLGVIARLGKRGSIASHVDDLRSKLDDKMQIIQVSTL